MKRKTIIPAVALVLVASVIGILSYRSSHVFVGGNAYPKDALSLDLRGDEISPEEYDALTQALPECDIAWDIPFQGTRYSQETQEIAFSELTHEDASILGYFHDLKTIDASGCRDYDLLLNLKEALPGTQIHYTVSIDGREWPQDTETLTISALTDADIQLMQYLPALTSVDAASCDDLDQLKKLQKTYPELELSYFVSICGENYDRFTSELILENADASDLAEALFHMPSLTSVSLSDPTGSAEELLALPEAYPNVRFSWTKEVLGVSISSTDTEVDLSGTAPESLETIEAELACFPAVEKLILCDLEFDNETMAAFREKMRPEYKVVWNVEVGYLTLRTDDTYYMPGKYNLGVTEEQAYNLRYCEDMICIDVGHKPLFTCEWAAFMPGLKYLIIADTMISDISPLEGLDQLIYLEMFITKVTDLTPLLTCTALQDLNLCYTHADPEPVKQMTWLNNLWWAESPIEAEEFQQYLPNTHLMFLHHSSTGNGWRQLQNYYDMRDILGMHYMWG